MQIASGYKVVGDLQDPWLLWREVFKKLYGWFARGALWRQTFCVINDVSRVLRLFVVPRLVDLSADCGD